VRERGRRRSREPAVLRRVGCIEQIAHDLLEVGRCIPGSLIGGTHPRLAAIEPVSARKTACQINELSGDAVAELHE
jgi:hypothetical protein